MKTITTLVIGDPHADPKHSNVRFEALGNFIVSTKPTNIVQMGDFLSLDSISEYNTGKPLLSEGARLKEDIAHGLDAYNKMMDPMRKHNERQAQAGREVYYPSGYWLQGNHEDRSYKLIQSLPALEGIIDTSSMVGAEKEGWALVPYKRYAYINGVAFTHIPQNRGTNKPISGKYLTARAAEICSTTVVFGHRHTLEVSPLSRHQEKGALLTFGVCCGWFGDYFPDYVIGNELTLDWWSGVLLLTHTGVGQIDIQTISMQQLKNKYL